MQLPLPPRRRFFFQGLLGWVAKTGVNESILEPHCWIKGVTEEPGTMIHILKRISGGLVNGGVVGTGPWVAGLSGMTAFG